MKMRNVVILLICGLIVASYVPSAQAGSFFDKFLKEKQPDVVVDDKGVVRDLNDVEGADVGLRSDSADAAGRLDGELVGFSYRDRRC